MDFQHLASTATSELVERLLREQAEASLQRIQALREALDAAAHAIAASADSGPDVQALSGRLSDALAEETGRVRDEAAEALESQREQLEAERAERAQLASALAQAHADHVRLESELQAAQEQGAAAEREAAAQAAAAAAQEEERRAEVERLTAALVEARSDTERVTADVHAERARAEAAEREAAAQAAAAAAQDDDRRAEIERLGAALAEARGDTERLAADLLEARERADVADRDLTLTIETHAEVEAALRQARREAQQAADARSAIDAELGQSRAALEQAATDAAQLRDRLAHGADTIAGLEARLTDAVGAGHERDALAAELEARGARIEALEGAVSQGEAHAHDLERRLLDATQAKAQMLEELAARELALEHERTAASGTREEFDTLTARCEATAVRVHALETELAASLARAQAIEGAHSAQLEHGAHLQARLDEAATLEARLREDLAGLGRDRTIIDAQRRDMEGLVALFHASARGVMEMAGATTSTDLLTGLVKRLSIQFSRVALFRAKGNSLEPEQQIGFDEALDPARHALPLSGDSLPARAARAGQAESLSGASVSDRTGLPFGGTPTAAVSLPIVLHGTTIAVVYADDADAPEAARGPAVQESSVAFAQLLVGHAVALLVRHTQELKTLAELQDYAATLLREAREMYLADVEGGRERDVLRSRLKENMDCASQLYAYRAAMEGTAAAALFDEQIAKELAADTPFARDLAQALGDATALESLIHNP